MYSDCKIHTLRPRVLSPHNGYGDDAIEVGKISNVLENIGREKNYCIMKLMVP